MKCCVILLVWALAAATSQASGTITSFEPDSARVQRDREPMIETPIWLGSNWGVNSLYRSGGDGLVSGPVYFSGIGLGATWPWKSRRQGYVEWHYGLRHVRHEYPGYVFVGGNFVPAPSVYTERIDLLALRGGVEQRFGRRRTPWCTAGGGTGYALNVGDAAEVAFELTARTTFFAYPTANTRVGLMLSAGPTWFGRGSGLYVVSGSGGEPSTLRTHFDLALRLERRLRFPKAVADAEE